MKPTQITELFANIKKTFVSFFSILMFVALGVGIYLGISWVSPGLQIAADKVFDEGSFHDLQIQFPYALADSDLEQLSGVEGVSDVEPGYVSYQMSIIGGKKQSVKVQTIGERINTLTIEEGELPTKPDEIALNADAAAILGVSVGDSIMFEHDATGDDSMSALSSMDVSSLDGSSDAAAQPEAKADDDGMKYLNGSTYKVTALARSPEYVAISNMTYGYSPVSASGAIDVVGWTLSSSFDPSAFQDGYPLVNVRCDDLRGMNSFSPEYVQQAAAVESRIVELGGGLADARYDDLHGKAMQKVADGEKQLAEAKQKIADGEKQLADGRAELKAKLAEANAKLGDAYRQLTNGQREYEAGLAEYNKLQGAYDETVAIIEGSTAEVKALAAEAEQNQEDYESGRITEEEYNKRCVDLSNQANAALDPLRQYYSDLPVVEPDNVTTMLIIAAAIVDDYRDIPFDINGEKMTLNEAAAKLAAARAELDAANNKLQNGWAEYYAGIDERDATVAEAEAIIADTEKQIEDGKEKVAENEPKLAEAKEQVAAMKDYSWTVTTRENNAGRGNVEMFSEITTELSLTMALLFIVVGLLVSYSAVSRIVHEQITQIGTKKALGLRKREITLSFLLYAGIAVLAGAIIGAIVGFVAVEGIIAAALRSMFTFGAFKPYFGLGLFLIVTLLELALVLGATYLACRGILKQHAVELLRGEKPPEAKTRFYEKWKVWDKVSLFTQIIVNNCVNDKRRVFSTIVGVAGCTALIVTAITLNNDVLKSYDKHYTEVYGFSDLAFIDKDHPDASIGIEKAYEAEGSKTAQVVRKSAVLDLPNGGSAAVNLIAPADADTFAQVYSVRPVDGEAFDPQGEGVWVSQAYKSHFGAKVGDEIEVDAGDGVVHKMPIRGFYGFWLTYNEIVIGSDYYEKEFDTKLAPNVVLASPHDASVEEMESKLSKVPGFDSLVDDKTKQYGNFATFSRVSSAVVLIYLVLSALMAVVVLLNLNVMFIDEKKRELIVLMINGFSTKDAKKYIYMDSIVLTVIGILLGLIIGCIGGSLTVYAVEPSSATLVKSIDPMAVAVGVVGSAVLAFIMSIIALRRIPRFELTDINKF